ncbi:MAG TPA: lysophospholipid acyltransferase family protein [bacterium]|nr:lysophospholipid acyltransferase family protein [bacterium]
MPKNKSVKFGIMRILTRMILFCVYLLIRIIPLQLHKPIADLLGLAMHKYIPSNRKLVMKHLEMAYGSRLSRDEIENIALKSNQHMVMNIFEFIRFPAMNSKSILSKVTFEGEEYLIEALEQNKGVIVLSGHYGNWEMLGAAIVAKGYSLTVVRRDQNDGLLNDVIQKQRDRKGIKTVPRNKPLFKHLIYLLKNNELVALIADQNAGPEGLFVDFFDRPAATFKGPGLFGTITGAPIIPIFMVRDGYMKHRVVIKPAVVCRPTGDTGQDIAAITQECTRVIENMIVEHPEQWMWQHRRWKTDPPGVGLS